MRTVGDSLVITGVGKVPHENSYSVYVDGEFRFNVSDQEVFKLGIYEGREVSEEDLRDFKHQAQVMRAKSAAVRFVSHKMRTVCETRLRLMEEFEEDAVGEVVNFLVQNGYLDDNLYVEKFIKEKMRINNLSSMAISYELEQRGISRELVENKLKQLDYDERVFAGNLVRKRVKPGGKQEQTRKMKEYLYRKGFTFDTINLVLKDY